MAAEKEIGLTLEDIAVLADGTGNIPDDTAVRLQPVICRDDRYAEELAALRQMAEDAATELLEDGLNIFKRLARLRQRGWKKPSDVLADPDREVPYRELIAMAGAMAGRARGAEKAELEELRERLILAYGEQLGGGKVVNELVGLEETLAEAVLSRVVGLYRLRRKKGGRKP